MTSAGPSCSIQPAGFLLALDDDWSIDAASANIGQFIDVAPDDLIGRPASEILADDAFHALRNRLSLLRDPEGLERLVACRLIEGAPAFDVALHRTEDRVVVEAEIATKRTFGDITGTLRGMSGRLDAARDLAEMLAAAARQIRALTGFDRVMILRVDPDGSSRIVAEHSRGPFTIALGEEFAGSAFAHGERQCLSAATLHLCADIDAEPAAVTTRAGHAPLTLERAILRPLDPDYGDQLRGMGARAVIRIALMVSGALWGVVLCLHHHPRSPGFERRSIADLFAQIVSLKIEILELKAEPPAA